MKVFSESQLGEKGGLAEMKRSLNPLGGGSNSEADDSDQKWREAKVEK